MHCYQAVWIIDDIQEYCLQCDVRLDTCNLADIFVALPCANEFFMAEGIFCNVLLNLCCSVSSQCNWEDVFVKELM